MIKTFPKNIQKIIGSEDLSTATLCVMLLRDTSTYTFDAADEFVSEILSSGGVELSAAGYARQVIQNTSLEISGSKVRIVGDNVAFGNIAIGQTVEAALFYIKKGSGTTGQDAQNLPLFYFDGMFKLTTITELLVADSPEDVDVSDVSQADPCEITTSGSHGLADGDVVVLTGFSGGMTELHTEKASYTVTVVDSTHFTLDNVDSSSFSAYSSGGVVKKTRMIYVMPLAFPMKKDTEYTFNGGGKAKVAGLRAAPASANIPKNATSIYLYSHTDEDITAGDYATVDIPLSYPVPTTGGTFTITFDPANEIISFEQP